MSFKPIRTFLEDRLLSLDSDFEVYKKPFSDDEVGGNNYDKRYHIFYGPVQSTVANQNVTQDTVLATVELYFTGKRDEAELLDNAMDFANKYRLYCLRPEFLVGLVNIKRVTCTGINPESLSTNDNALKITLSFNINMIFGTGITLDNEDP